MAGFGDSTAQGWSIVRVAWTGSAASRERIERLGVEGLKLESVAPEDLVSTRPDVAYLELDAVGGVGPAVALRERLSCGVVIACSAAQADAAMPLLQDADDLSLTLEPPRLVAHRLLAVAGRTFPARDGLTGLFHRKHHEGRLNELLASASRQAPVSVLLMDIDHFKRLNDAHGHEMGDQVLREVAQRILTGAPAGALASRYGGEEFTLVIQEGVRGTLHVADQLLQQFRSELTQGFDVRLSAGCATADRPTSVVALMREAGQALYAAKAHGRDRTVHFDDLEREALAQDRDVALEAFQNQTRVLTERVAEFVTGKGREIFGRLREQADVDGLTGLYNRRYFDRRLDLEVSNARESELPMTVALLDVDHFGAVNKQHGWPTGDRVLIELASRIHSAMRTEDWVARYGGEEICVVMHGTRLVQAASVLERIRRTIEEQPFQSTRGEPLRLTVSIGAAELGPEDLSLDVLLERASSMLLTAKGAGRNRVAS